MTRRSKRNQGQKQKKEKRRQKKEKRRQKKEKRRQKKEKRDKSIPLTKVINAPLMLTEVIINAALHHFGYFLDHSSFGALEPVSPSMRENLQMIIWTRNQKLPVGKRMANLNKDFTVWNVCKRVLQFEGLYPLDMIATGRYIDEDDPYAPLVNTVMSLDLVTKRCTTLTTMIHPRRGHATAVLNGKLFIMGGENDYGGRLSSVECLDLETGQRSEMAPMTTPRFEHQAAVLDGKIYVAGGSPVNSMGTLVESFDAATNQWTAVAPMNTGRKYHGLVSVQGKLFAVGGFNYQDRALSSVECFDPSTRVWSNIAPLNTARQYLKVAVLGDKLYAIGGQGSQRQLLSSVECLDLSVPKSKWTSVPPMNSGRSDMGTVVTVGKIYVAGGFGYEASSIECFDPNDGPEGRWTVMRNAFEIRDWSRLILV
jgi:N-acetylneuraminic acid mutarotase